MQPNYELYLVTDESIHFPRLLNQIELAVQHGVTVVQLREKNRDGKQFYERAKAIKSITDHHGIPLIINDRIDIALAINADGVHIGQEDIPLTEVRRIVPKKMIVGLSVSTIEEAQEAERNGANYVGVGAAFQTKSKKDAEVLPEGMLEKIARTVHIPVVAIGGISIENLHLLKGKNLAGVAVISALLHAENTIDAVQSMKKIWRQGSA